MATYKAQSPGKPGGGGYHYYALTLTINETNRDPDNNQSTVTFSLTLGEGENTGGTAYGTLKWEIWIDDYHNSGTKTYDFGTTTKSYTLLSNTTKVITHNPDGKKTIIVKGYVEDQGEPISTLYKFYTPNSTGGEFELTSFPRDPLVRLKESGTWKQGKPWIKTNGTWVKGKKVYVKDGVWKETPLKG